MMAWRIKAGDPFAAAAAGRDADEDRFAHEREAIPERLLVLAERLQEALDAHRLSLPDPALPGPRRTVH